MSGKLLRRPLPPAKVERPTSPLVYQCDQKINQSTNQYTTLKSKGDTTQPPQIPQILILGDDDETISPLLPRNPPPSRIAHKSNSYQDVASWVKAGQSFSRSTECGNSRSQFPMRAPRKLATHGSMISKMNKEETKPMMSLSNERIEDLIVQVSKISQVCKPYAKKIVYSKHTYEKMTKMVSERYLRQPSRVKHLKVVDIPTEELGEFPRRVPQRQLLIELAGLIKEHMRETMKIDVHAVIQPMPRFHFGAQNKPETEIILYQQKTSPESPVLQSLTQRDIDRILQDDCLASGETKFFQGGRRTSTPFCISDESMASPTEIAILDALLYGASELNLKAHFISFVPDISFLKDRLTSVNISFNNFVTLPCALLQLVNLEVLKARDNPLSEIPAEIRNLKNLKTLIISFCLLSTFPPQFFELEMLQNLDLSYNRLHHIPSQMANLKSLQELGLEGNQLTLLPATILSMDLRFLSLKNNFTHHLFWQTTKKFYLGRANVKSLKELSAATIYNHNFSEGPVKQIQDILLSQCMYCHSAMGSKGFYDIRIHRKVFGQPALLFLYEACSSFCMEALR